MKRIQVKMRGWLNVYIDDKTNRGRNNRDSG